MAKFDVRPKQDDESVMDFYIGCYDKVNATDFPDAITSFTSDAFREKKEKGQFVRYIKDLVLPSTITNIPSNAFEGCEKLKTIIIPDSVRSIEKNAFKNCVILNEVVLSSDVVELPSGLFSGCKSLTKIVVRNTSSLLKIAKDAFRGCNLDILRFEIKEGDVNLTPQETLNIRNKYFEAVKAKVNANCFKRLFSNCDIETKLLNGFDKLLVSKLKDLDPIRKGIVQILGLNDYKKMPNVEYNGILLISSEENLPTDLFLGQSIVGTWYWHPKRNQFVPYTVDIEERLLVEKYKDFVTFLFSQGANSVDFSYKETKVESITKDEIAKSSINAKTSENVPGNVDSKNGIDISDAAKSFEKTLKKEVLKSTAIPKVSSVLPKLLWYSEEELKELKQQFENKKSWDYSISLSNELRTDTTQKKTIDSSLDSIYGKLDAKYDKTQTVKLEFNYDQEIKLYVTFGSEAPNPSSPEPKSDDSEKKKTELPELRYLPKDVSVERRDDTTALFDSLHQNQFVNLVGMGGMGKTCLANLLVKDYSKEYGNVVYSLINGSFYSDITDKDSQLKLIADRYKMSVGDKVLDSIANTGNEITGALFRTLVNVLDDNYTARQNLWIIDVNETADYAQVREALKYMFSDKHLNENWRVLIVSRVAFIEKKELRNSITRVEDLTNSKDFLKQVFFHYLVDYTKDEDDTERYLKKNIYEDKVNNGKIVLDKILEVLFENPLLIEQLASYLRDIDTKDQQQILDLFVAKDENGNILTQEEVSESVKRDKKLEYEFLAQYLSSLVFFNKLDDLRQNKRNEHKEIARHLMLWPADFYKVDDIFTLMRGATFKDKDDLQKYLNYMSEQRIVEKQTDDKGVSSYKMHGLIADALRVQVLRDHKDMQGKEVSDNFRNYSQYLANIEKLKDTSSEIKNCLSFCFAQTKMTSETYLPAEFFDTDKNLFKTKFLKKLADLTRETPLYEKWYKLKLIEEVCGIEDHTQKFDKYQEYKDKSSHKVYEENYTPSQGNEIDQDLKTEVLSQMVELKAGEFVMGGTEKYEGSPHNVKISSFYIGKYPVTQKLWKRVMGSLPDDSDYDSDRFRGDRKPVIDVNWYDCMDFIIKFNAMTGLQFRLPTEAEWEYACRCSGVEKYKLDDVAWYGKNSGNQLHEVGTTNKASELIIQDMLGNVWEWCSDWAGSYSDEPQVDPQGPSMGSSRVNRGGGWFNDGGCCRVAYRNDGNPCYRVRDYHVGFRLALSLQFKK